MAAVRRFTAVEVCAGAGGQALGIERAGFEHLAMVEIDRDACATLRENFRDSATVVEEDVRLFLAGVRRGSPLVSRVDLLAAGVPCPPFSVAGRQLGEDDARDLFPVLLDLVELLSPRAVMVENVRGLLGSKFDEYRHFIRSRLTQLGYSVVGWSQLNACDFGVPQLRPRSVLVAVRAGFEPYYAAPKGAVLAPTVGQALAGSMSLRGLSAADCAEWSSRADRVAPTLVGGSKKHGGADLGPTRAKAQWHQLGVDGHGVADDEEPATLTGPKGRGPRLTVAQAAILQGFPAHWQFKGRKTARYRQVGNAFPPPVAYAVASAISDTLRAFDSEIAPRIARKDGEQSTRAETRL